MTAPHEAPLPPALEVDGAPDGPRPEHLAPAPPGDGGAGLAFWGLILLALAGLVPSLLLPAWRDYQAAELAERQAAARVASFEEEIARERRNLDAIHNDPAVVSRLAQRELELREPGATLLPVPSTPTGANLAAYSAAPASPRPTAEPAKPPLQPTAPPAAVARLVALLPAWNYDALFCQSPARETMLGLSTALLIAAFLIFWPRTGTDPQTEDLP